jgi:3-methyladenine DNA glycosylase AlkD
VDIQELYAEIKKRLERLVECGSVSEKRLKWFRQQHRTPGVTSYGLSTPAVRKLIRGFKREFQQLSLEEKCSLAIALYKSGNFEEATIGDTLMEFALPSLTPVRFDLLDQVAGHFNNWASVDWLCLHGFQSILLKYRRETLELLRKWNRSNNLWKRRASVVAFVGRIGASGKFTDAVLELCCNLIRDRQEIVQKGVGWALKDNLSGNRRKVIDYIKELRRQGVPSAITLYAIRDVKGIERSEVLSVKARRKDVEGHDPAR